MSYFLSKLLPLFIYPLGLAIIVCLLLLLFGWRRQGSWTNLSLMLVVLLLWVPSTSIFADFVIGTLEKKYPPVAVKNLPIADAIVILGGMTRGMIKQTGMVEVSESVDRLLFGTMLYKEKKAPVVFLSGGGEEDYTPESVLMAKILEQLGVPVEAMVLETRSRNTYQNAVNLKPLLDEHGIKTVLLVTSAYHMKRAAGLFKNLGVEIVPAPTDYQVLAKEALILNWLPSAEALNLSTVGIKEYFGWWYYSLGGWI